MVHNCLNTQIQRHRYEGQTTHYMWIFYCAEISELFKVQLYLSHKMFPVKKSW